MSLCTTLRLSVPASGSQACARATVATNTMRQVAARPDTDPPIPPPRSDNDVCSNQSRLAEGDCTTSRPRSSGRALRPERLGVAAGAGVCSRPNGRVGQTMFRAIHSIIRRELPLCALLLAAIPAAQACGDKLIGLGGGAPFAR